jgi:hypothetical protein
VPTITDFDAFNLNLLELCEKDGNRPHYQHNKDINELCEEDKNKLLTLPIYEYLVFKIETVAVNKYGYVTFETNKYSVFPEISGQKVQLKIYFENSLFF